MTPAQDGSHGSDPYREPVQMPGKKMTQDIEGKINDLKKKRNAIILAHNYQIPEVQEIADYRGDSLGLSREAAKTRAEVIVFCGVHFMAETAAILSPEKKVLIPDPDAGCPMADMITAKDVQELRRKHPGAVVIAYVNTSAEVKAETDICCTSANAAQVVESVDKKRDIIFIPDKYLGDYISRKTGRDLILWGGYCPTHVRIFPEDIKARKEEHPGSEVLVHPECTPRVIELADQVLSTSGMCRYASRTQAREMIIGTEIGIIHRLKTENPAKTFYPASQRAVCPNMKLINLEKVLWALEGMEHQVVVPEEIASRARRAVDAMLQHVS